MQDTWVQIHDHFTYYINPEVTKSTVYPTALPQYLKLQLSKSALLSRAFTAGSIRYPGVPENSAFFPH